MIEYDPNKDFGKLKGYLTEKRKNTMSECKWCSCGYCVIFDTLCNGVNLCGVDEE